MAEKSRVELEESLTAHSIKIDSLIYSHESEIERLNELIIMAKTEIDEQSQTIDAYNSKNLLLMQSLAESLEQWEDQRYCTHYLKIWSKIMKTVPTGIQM